jgi:hypothetical protein
MEREFCEYERKMNNLLHTMHEALETCNAETTSELCELNTMLANQGEVLHNQAVTIASLTSALDTCNAKWQIFEGEIDLIHDKVAALENSVCRCAQAPAPERIPSPHFSQADSLESYRTPPIATPPRENSTPLPVAMANAVLESDEENRPPWWRRRLPTGRRSRRIPLASSYVHVVAFPWVGSILTLASN